MFPAVKAIGEGKGEKLFYLTAKTITRTVAEEAFWILRGSGLIFSSVTITAKEKLCPLEETECNPDHCPYAKGHFDRVNEAVFDILHLEQDITREKILSYAERYQVCPFEYCLDISSWTDGIICDYNYVFDPNVRLKRYFAEGAKGEYLFLIDEAHNLVSRAREMYSAAIRKEDVLETKRLIKGRSAKLERQLDKCNKVLLEMKRECEDWQILEDVTGLAAAVMSVFSEFETFLEDNQEFEGRDAVLDFYFCLRDFLGIYERLDELDPYSVDNLLTAHGIMTRGLVEESGVFHTRPVGVVDSEGHVLHFGALPQYVPDLVMELLDWVKTSEVHMLIRTSAVVYSIMSLN